MLGILLLFNYTAAAINIYWHNQKTDLEFIYDTGAMLNQHASPYHYTPQYLQEHHYYSYVQGRKNTFIPSLAPPFTAFIATLVAKSIRSATFFVLFTAITLGLNIWALSRLYTEFYKNRHTLYFYIFLLANFLYTPTINTILYGQVSLLFNAMVIGVYLSLKNGHEKRAGFLLALAANIKLFFLFFLLYFWIGKKKQAFFSMVFFSACFSVLPVLFYGKIIYANYLDLLLHVFWYASNWNASIYGFLCRIFGESSHRYPALFFFPKITETLYYLFFIGYTALFYYLIKKKSAQPELLFSFTLSSMLMLSPLGWSYYFPLLVTALLINIKIAKNNAHGITAFSLMLFAIFLSTIAYSLWEDIPKTLHAVLLPGGLAFFSLLLFHTATLLLFFGKTIATSRMASIPNIFIFSISFFPALISTLALTLSLFIHSWLSILFNPIL